MFYSKQPDCLNSFPHYSTNSWFLGYTINVNICVPESHKWIHLFFPFPQEVNSMVLNFLYEVVSPLCSKNWTVQAAVTCKIEIQEYFLFDVSFDLMSAAIFKNMCKVAGLLVCGITSSL